MHIYNFHQFYNMRQILNLHYRQYLNHNHLQMLAHNQFVDKLPFMGLLMLIFHCMSVKKGMISYYYQYHKYLKHPKYQTKEEE